MSFSLFLTSFGPRFFEHRFCIVLGSIFLKRMDRPFGDNRIFTEDTLRKDKEEGFACSEIASMFQCFSIDWGSISHSFGSF